MNKAQINKELYNLPKTATFQVNVVLEWIKHNQEVSRSMAKEIRMNTKGAIAQRSMRDGYIKDMRHYLRTGDWISPFYGKDMQDTTKTRVIAYGDGVY
jgi:ABC-type oligopeptide transport system ATPase subunit|tara:strand:- start:645 stop:938 length:294 start_codon:yes stop_codon:yes gene_type:complete